MADAAVAIRPATTDDARVIWEWRNDQVSRAFSSTVRPVPWEEHEAWFTDALRDPERRVLVATADGQAVGMIRFDAAGEPGTWRVSINLAPEVRGRGLARPALDAATAWLVGESGHDVTVVADVRRDNLASLRTFQAAGFAPAATSEGWVELRQRAGP